MLQFLSIKNYALISQLEINFNLGFTIITGETGAGKSIVLDALSLILGQRADVAVLKNKTEKCIVEAIFEVSNLENELSESFKNQDIDFENQLIIRREISPNGKSRAFVNDSPTNLNFLKELTEKLIDVHSQHSNLLLNESHFQLKVVDAFARNESLLSNYFVDYQQFKQISNRYSLLLKQSIQSQKEADYYQFQFDQISQVKLLPEEQESLENELQILTHTEEIKRYLASAEGLLLTDENGIISNLKEILNSFSHISSYFSAASTLSERIKTVYYELKDISQEIEFLNEKIDCNPQRIVEVQDRLDIIYKLQHKHRVSTVRELLEIQADFEKKLQEINSYEGKLEKLKLEISNLQKILEQKSMLLSESRIAAIPNIEQKITEMLFDLGIPNASFRIQRVENQEFNATGRDEVMFLFSANKNVEVQEISKIASGGEISRLMLSIKSLISESIKLPTLIFDEIDSGISGEIAHKMGEIIKQMAKNSQIINITHLPQVASKGDFHYKVYKLETEVETSTKIRLLSHEERVQEIAKMLSGKQLTEIALQNAREFLEHS